MSTAIAVYNSDGCVGRCDAKCHDASPLTPCTCICGGRLHAKADPGERQEIILEQLTPAVIGEEVLAFAERNDLDPGDLDVQLRLQAALL